jgi:ATP-dependent Clp protease ATP-binding subunit ClpA
MKVQGTIAHRALRNRGLDYVVTEQMVLHVIAGWQANEKPGKDESEADSRENPMSAAAASALEQRTDISAADRTPYTPHMRKLVDASRADAHRIRSDEIAPAHYLLGMLRLGDCLAVQALKRLRVDVDLLEAEAEALAEAEEETSREAELGNSSAGNALATARMIARSLRHNWVGTEHMLLGLIQDEKDIADCLLANFDIDYEMVREAVLQVIDSPNPQKSG